MNNAQYQHISSKDWQFTPSGEPRGYIQPAKLRELWFHTGTICNLSCPFCLEGSKPGDDRLNKITFEDAKPFIDEAMALGVEKFSFTGGEPFVIKDIVRIIGYALDRRPCLVLTNATEPLKKRMDEIRPLLERPHSLNFRVSLDYSERERHDAGRGAGNFDRSCEMLEELHRAGFGVSVARQMDKGEDASAVDAAYRRLFLEKRLPAGLKIIKFPDFFSPDSNPSVPQITEDCMTRYQTEETRAGFMCSFSKMVIKRRGMMKVTACTLVDDDEDYDLADSLSGAMNVRVMLRHHRCYSCFSCGASCSEK